MKRNLAIWHECGCGKTVTAIKVIDELRSRNIGPALVVCPLSIIDAAWLSDIEKYAKHLSAISLYSKKPSERTRKLNESHDIYIVNYEQFKIMFDEIDRKGFQVIVLDESSKIKNIKSQITQAALAFAGMTARSRSKKKYITLHTIPFRYCLSGTPAPNSELEYWAQAKFITGKGNTVFNDNYYAFRGKYFHAIPIGGNGLIKIYKCRKSLRGELLGNLDKISHVVRKADALDLPEQVCEAREVELSGGERSAYESLKNDLVLRLKDSLVLAATSLAEIMKLRQLTSGFVYVDQDKAETTGHAKLRELQGLLDEIGDSQAIIWTNFHHEVNMIKAVLKDKAVAVTGQDGNEDRDRSVKLFTDNSVQYLISNPACLGHGMTFANCHYAIYFSLSYSHELHDQSMNRIHRIGQNKKCTYFYLIAKNTIDETILSALQSKQKIAGDAMYYLRSLL